MGSVINKKVFRMHFSPLGAEEQSQIQPFSGSFTTAQCVSTNTTPVSYPSSSMVYPASNYPPVAYNGLGSAYGGYPPMTHAHIPNVQHSPHYNTCAYPAQHNQPSRYHATTVPANVPMNYGYHGNQVMTNDPTSQSSYVQ